MVDVTLLEVNLEGSQFTAHAPFSGKKSSDGKVSRLLGKGDDGDSNSDDDAEAADGDAEDAEDDGSSPFAAVAAIAVLVVLALVVRKLRGGPDRETPEELDVEPDDVA